MANSFASPPPPTSFSRLSFPAPYILLVTFSRPKALNCINSDGHRELDAVWNWFDYEPSLRVAVVTGEGRAFCAGADLKEWNNRQSGGADQAQQRRKMVTSGFGGLSTRTGRKPIIAAVNGIAFGGGTEIIINCDLVLAAQSATFSLPEVKRGVAAIAGALPRLVRTVGKQRAMEMALTGRTLSAEEAREWGLVNKVVGGDKGGAAAVVDEAVAMASVIAANSPDSVIVSRQGVRLGWERLSAQEGTEKLVADWYGKLESGENIKEGLMAFVEKREPRWVDSKL